MSPTKEFIMERRLGQGDPFSPFLFLIVVEELSGMVKKVMEIGEFSGFMIKEERVIDILKFVDDTLLVDNGNCSQVWSLKAIYIWFKLVSGLRVNFLKSKLIGINTSPHFISAAANFLFFRIEETKFSFLGLPIVSIPRRISSWLPLIRKIKARLSCCKWRFLSLGGRITLLKLVWGDFEIYDEFSPAVSGSLHDLRQLFSAVSLTREGANSVVWKYNVLIGYTVKLGYASLNGFVTTYDTNYVSIRQKVYGKT
ncbi:uncharacterized protein LOC131620095 [Vicia villosa]|uniref:uncharacterized protein LOC131620095 n=1 Tax=Vicia villosa TaxID=3911 RepID=UPI00273B649B|nr:uncharacterized protein LOC131620095 [Vicia villosa]